MRYGKFLLLLLVGLSGGCLAQPPAKAPEVIKQVPYRINVDFSSELPDRYYVMSGPAFTYGRFRVNKRFSALLRQRTVKQSNPTSSTAVQLEVHITALHTDFEEIGLGPTVRPLNLAMAGMLASANDGGMGVQDNMDRGDFNLPETTYKTADMDLLVSLQKGGQVIAKRPIRAHFTEQHDWYNETPDVLLDRHRYDYGSVLEGVYREALKEISRFIEETLLPQKQTGT